MLPSLGSIGFLEKGYGPAGMGFGGYRDLFGVSIFTPPFEAINASGRLNTQKRPDPGKSQLLYISKQRGCQLFCLRALKNRIGKV
jgi:hypothetical protein